jgi:hypothetical protein
MARMTVTVVAKQGRRVFAEWRDAGAGPRLEDAIYDHMATQGETSDGPRLIESMCWTEEKRRAMGIPARIDLPAWEVGYEFPAGMVGDIEVGDRLAVHLGGETGALLPAREPGEEAAAMATATKAGRRDALDEIEALVDAAVRKGSRLSRERIMTEILGSRPELYAAYERQRVAGQLRRRAAESTELEPSPRAKAKREIWDLIQAKAGETIAKGAGESHEAHVVRFLATPLGAKLYALYDRV